MCGLFGYSIRPDMMDKVDVHTMTAMLAYFADRRGRDSWGVVKLDDPTGVPTVVKDVGSITKTCRIPRIIAPVVIGHTRAATVGAISKRNAHPFMVGDILGAHNGHISNHIDLNAKYKRTCQVDSEHIFHQINENLPIEELSGSGTITFVNLKQPGRIFFGRGSSSDLEIFGLGPQDAPWGTLWTSIGMWGEDALEMAGIEEYDIWDTRVGQAYELENYKLSEIGEFSLSYRPTYKPSAYQDYRSLTHHGTCHHSGNIPKIYNHETRMYEESKTIDEYWTRLRERQVAAGIIGKDDVEHLPPSLKKNTEVGVLGPQTGQDEKVTEASLQCDGCSKWGNIADGYEEDPEGIVEAPTVGEWLCYQCFCFWGTQTNPRTKQDVIDVPTLSLNMEY